MIEVYADLGLDFVWLDFEHSGHSPYHSPGFLNLARTADAANIDLLVRVPSADPPVIRKVLDAGIRTILIPRVETPEEVRHAIRASRFKYENKAGDRGVAAGRPSNWGALLDGFVVREDEQVMVGVMIENTTAIDNLEEILAIPELGFVFIGPADLSVSMGHPMEVDHPEVRETIDTIRKKSLKAGVPVARIANGDEAIQQAINKGYSMLRIGGEVASAREVLSSRLETVER